MENQSTGSGKADNNPVSAIVNWALDQLESLISDYVDKRFRILEKYHKKMEQVSFADLEEYQRQQAKRKK